MKIIFTAILCFISFCAFTCPIRFHITDVEGKKINGATISIGGKQYGVTDNKGTFLFDLSPGTYTITARQIGYDNYTETVTVACDSATDFTLKLVKKTDHVLDEVVVNSVTAKQIIDKSPFSVQSIDLKKFYSKTGDIGEILTRTSGIKVRTDGSVGAPVQINLGGLQGKAVRIFRDGVPIELFGHGFNITTIPANMLERVDVYIGVMPVHLASDALGGGLDLVTRQDNKSMAEISYEYGSFNTHRVTVNGLRRSKDNRWYAGTNSSFNYSDNNYRVSVPIPKGSSNYKDVKRFHDATRTHYAEAYAGIKNRTWADDLRLTVINSAFHKELQHDAQMVESYGQAFSKENNFTSLVNYRKNLFNQKLKLNAVGAYSYFDTRFVDTATVRYGWDGQIISRNQRPGEFNLGNNQQLDYNLTFGRINASYELSENHTLDLSELFQHQRRKGSDPLGAISPLDGIDVLTEPAVYRKDVTALGIRSNWLDKNLESIFAFKYYHFNTRGYTTDKTGTGYLTTGSQQNIGYLGGVRWSKGNYLLKLSYEHATRLPDEYEVFGDGVVVRENLTLKPERSHNINLNGEYRWFGANGNNLTLSGSAFYRRVRDGIFFQLDIPFNRFINYDQTEVKGLELEANYTSGKRFNLGINATYQDIRQVDIKEDLFKYLEGARVPNVPYLFGNIWLNTYFHDLAKKGDRLEVNWNANYTHRFFLFAIPKGLEPALFEQNSDVSTSLIIPRDGRLGQMINNAGLYYRFAKSKVSLAAECRNIGNTMLYDNFNVQKPGRAYYLKLTYQIL